MPPTENKKPIVPDVQLSRVRFSPCGTILAAAAHDGTVRRWNSDDFAELPKLPGHNGWTTDLVFHTDKTRLFSSDSWGRLIAWDYTAKEPKKLWEVPAAHDGWLRRLALTPDGNTLATVGRDGVARTWDASNGKKRLERNAKEDLLSVAYHPDGELITGDLRGSIAVWDSAGKSARTLDAKELYSLDRIQDVGGVRALAFDSDARTIFVAGAVPKTGGFVECTPLLLAFDWKTGKRTGEWKGANEKEGFVHDLRWHTAGHLMGVCSGQPGQGKLFFWKPGEAKPFFETTKMANCHSLDLHPDGKRIAVSATNANSSGNGRVKGKAGEYPGNFSPITIWNI